MTGNLILDLVISVGGIIIVVAISWALGAARLSRVTEADVIERAAFDEPDFDPSEWLVGKDGMAALAVAKNGESLIAFRVGDRIATRRFAAGAAPANADGPTVVFRLADPGAPAVRIRTADANKAKQWAARLC